MISLPPQKRYKYWEVIIIFACFYVLIKKSKGLYRPSMLKKLISLLIITSMVSIDVARAMEGDREEDYSASIRALFNNPGNDSASESSEDVNSHSHKTSSASSSSLNSFAESPPKSAGSSDSTGISPPQDNIVQMNEVVADNSDARPSQQSVLQG